MEEIQRRAAALRQQKAGAEAKDGLLQVRSCILAGCAGRGCWWPGMSHVVSCRQHVSRWLTGVCGAWRAWLSAPPPCGASVSFAPHVATPQPPGHPSF